MARPRNGWEKRSQSEPG